jgi:drug/metabolite transporter (DMT)-like permease
MTAALFALCAAALWGTGDFLGGLTTKRVSVLTVLFWSQLVGLAGLVIWVVASGEKQPGHALGYAAAGGVAGVVGLGCLYRGLAIGAMGIVAPISATSPIVPLGVDLARGESPEPLQWLGIVFALAGVVLVAREPSSIHARRPAATGVGLALVAALGFGLFLVGLGEAAQGSASWATATARLTAVTALLLVLVSARTVPRASVRLLPLIAAVGVFDAAANALIAVAATRGAIGIVAVLSALYPIATIVLARAILHERLGTARTIGGLIALGGAALIAGG